MSGFYSVKKFIQHRLQSRGWDSFHSPYLFKLFSYCCDDKILIPEIEKIEAQRNKLMNSKDSIDRTDFGAGKINSDRHPIQPISSIARQSLSLPFQCRFLYKLLKWTKPGICIEFGTCLGITSLYLAYGIDGGKIISIEGDPVLASMAQNMFDQMQVKNIEAINSTFEDFVNKDLKELEAVDFIFIDGNHRSEPLLSYYHALKPHIRSHTIIMVDDIYWSSDMNSGWRLLTEMPEVTQSVDCFQFGLLFFSADFISKQNHFIRLPLKSIK